MSASSGNAPLVLVTGASSGIGQAVALQSLANGWHVLAGVRRDEDAQALAATADATARERLTCLHLDVTNADDIERAAVAVTRLGGRLDALVNNAGICVAGPLEVLPVEAWRQQLDVNVIGQVAITRALLPALRAARGRIVFISSISGEFVTPLLGPYCASKFAIEAIAVALRGELLPSGISVSVVAPGPVRTAIWERSRRRAKQDTTPGADLAPESHAAYDAPMERLRALTHQVEKRAVPVDDAARVVMSCLTARRAPRRVRVAIGPERFLLRLVPAAWSEYLASLRLGFRRAK